MAGRLTILARRLAVLACLLAVGVTGQPVHRRVETRVAGALALLRGGSAVLDERRSIRRRGIPVSAAPGPIDVRLRAVAGGGFGVLGSPAGIDVASLCRAVTSLSGTISSIRPVEQRGEHRVGPGSGVLAVVRGRVALVSIVVALVGDPVALVRDPVALIRCQVAVVRGPLPLVAQFPAHVLVVPSVSHPSV